MNHPDSSRASNLSGIFPALISNCKIIWENKRVIPGVFLIILSAMGVHCFATGVDEIVKEAMDGHLPGAHLLISTGAFLLLAFVGLVLTWLYKHTFSELQVRYQVKSDAKPRPNLILFVSPQTLLPAESSVPAEGACTVSDGVVAVSLQRRDPILDADALVAGKVRWNWEMLLRALAPHLPVLDRVFLIGSSGNQGSHAQLGILRRLLAPYLVAARRAQNLEEAVAKIETVEPPIDFEDFKAVDDVLRSIRRRLSQSRSGDNTLCVDITGGQKPNSAAAGAFTMNNDVVIQYVRTNDPKTPQMYDVRLLSVPSGEN